MKQTHDNRLTLLFIINLLSLAFFFSTKTHAESGSQASYSLQPLWELNGLNNPESVVYDQRNQVLYVSNVNGAGTDKNGQGYIAKASLKGKLLQKHWLTGLNAPKGMAIQGNRLFVTDIDSLIEIDIPSVKIVGRYPVADAKFLNDAAAGAKQDIYVSDMQLNRIHRLHNKAFNIWLQSPALQNPNGLLVQGDQLIVGAWGVMTEGFATATPGQLKSIRIADKTISNIGNAPLGNLDGVESDGQNGYFVTDWMAGKLYHIDNRGNASLILTLQQGMADLAVITDKQMLLLPMMQDNQLLAYRYKRN